MISDWPEACDEQAEVLDKFEPGAPVARVWCGESLPRRLVRHSAGVSRTTEEGLAKAESTENAKIEALIVLVIDFNCARKD